MLPSMTRQAAKTRTKLTLGIMALLSCSCCGATPLLRPFANARGKVRGRGALAQGRAALSGTVARVSDGSYLVATAVDSRAQIKQPWPDFSGAHFGVEHG